MLYALFKTHVETSPQNLAVTDGSQSLTYTELNSRVVSTAGFIQSTVGTRKAGSNQATVAMCMDHSLRNIQTVLAASLTGVQLCTLDPNLSQNELKEVLKDYNPEAVFTEPKYAPKLLSVRKSMPRRPRIAFETQDEPTLNPTLIEERSGWADDFLVLYTSGSTGTPKGVVQSQDGLITRLRNWILESRIDSRDSHLCILPLSHAYGLVGVALPALCSGGTLHLLSQETHTPQELLRYLENRRISCFYGLPLHYWLMLRAPTEIRTNLASLRIATVGAGPIDETTLVSFEARFGVPLNINYGTSETGVIAYNHRSLAAPPLSIGKPIAGVEHELRDPRVVDDRTVGELFVKTNAMATRYTAGVAPITTDRWFGTGDLAYEDSTGHLHLCGRTSSLINVAGNKFSPSEIEGVIAGIEGVADVAVLSVIAPAAGEKVVAFIVKKGELSEADIRSHCRQKLAGFKVPALIRWIDQVPRSALNKIRRSELLKYLPPH